MDSRLIPMSLRIRSGAGGAQIGIQQATSRAVHVHHAVAAASRELQSAATVAALLLPLLQSCQSITA